MTKSIVPRRLVRQVIKTLTTADIDPSTGKFIEYGRQPRGGGFLCNTFQFICKAGHWETNNYVNAIEQWGIDNGFLRCARRKPGDPVADYSTFQFIKDDDKHGYDAPFQRLPLMRAYYKAHFK